MFWQNKKKFDFLSLIFDSRNILAASLKNLVKGNIYYIDFTFTKIRNCIKIKSSLFFPFFSHKEFHFDFNRLQNNKITRLLRIVFERNICHRKSKEKRSTLVSFFLFHDVVY